MKKIITLTIVLLLTLSINAQKSKTRFGVATGFLLTDTTAEILNTNFYDTSLGYYAGISLNFPLSKNLEIIHQINYYSTNILMVPILAKISLPKKFGLIVGPQFSFELQKTPDDFNYVNYGVQFGTSYDFDKNFALQWGYYMQINNFYKGDLDLSSRSNYFNFSYIFKF